MNGPENCTNCKFSAEAEGQGLLCRRNPPVPVSVTATPFISGEGREFKMETTQVFPSVSAVTWCGEYRPDHAEFARRLNNLKRNI